MKTKHEFILAFVATFILVLTIQSNMVGAADPGVQSTVNSAASKQPAIRLTISGTIKNFDEFVACVIPKTTYIQLVPIPADGVIWTSNKYDDKGKLSCSFVSDLAKLPVPKKESFSLEVLSILPGRYFIAAQRSNLSWFKASEGPMFLTDKGAMFIIDVPADDKSPFSVKAGDLIVNLKNSSNLSKKGVSKSSMNTDQKSRDDIDRNAKDEKVQKAAMQKILDTLEMGTFKDPRDGKIYKTVKIGTQWLMSENLAYKPNNGKYWGYENNPDRCGYAYNWETAKIVAPDGWHLPAKAEWETLYNYFGGDEKAFAEMKEGGRSGFNALLCGYCEYTGNFFSKGTIAQFWSSTTSGVSNVWTFRFNKNFHAAGLQRAGTNGDISSGYSVRLFKDN